MYTDYQKDCISKAKDHLHLIPRIDHIIRWKDMPGKVAAIITLLIASKLSIVDFAKELKISSKALRNFAKGKDSSGQEWSELFELVKPNEAKKKEDKQMSEKAESVVSSKIIALLSRAMVSDIGLRDETIKVELKSVKPRFVSTILNKLEKQSKITRFVGDNKKVMWKLKVESVLRLVPELPTIVSSSIENQTVIDFPKPRKTEEEVKADSLKWAWETILSNLKPEQVAHIDEKSNKILIHAPLNESCFNFPYSEWRKVLVVAISTFPSWCPHLVSLYNKPLDWVDDQVLWIAVKMTQQDKKFKCEQEVVDHFAKLLSLGET